MPIFDRPLVTDRPTVIDPVLGSDEEDESELEEEDRVGEERVETLGEGGGEVVHGLEFEEGQEHIIKASNLVAILATGQEEGRVYTDTFKNAAFQLAEVDQNGHTTEGMVDLSESLNVAYLGTSESELENTDSGEDSDETEEDESEDGAEEVEDDDSSDSENLDEVDEYEETSEE